MKNTLETNNIPANDTNRVAVLKRYQILDTAPEKSFNNIAKLATLLFELPISLISFIDTDSVFLKAQIGVEGHTHTPRGNSLCSTALLTNKVTVFEDIPKMDPCLLINPALVAELGFNFYAGAPITTPDGFRIGVICVIGNEKRSFSEKDKELLQALAQIVMDGIETRYKGIFDTEQKLTGTDHRLP